MVTHGNNYMVMVGYNTLYMVTIIMVIHGYSQSYRVICYTWLHMVIHGYSRLYMIKHDYSRLYMAILVIATLL